MQKKESPDFRFPEVGISAHHTHTFPQRIKALVRSAFRFCLTKINKRVFHSYLCLLLAKEGSLCSEGCLLLLLKLICGQSDYH